MTNVNEIEAALRHLDSQDRDQWVRIGAAIKTELGEDGFNVWDAWSQDSDNYKKNDAKSVWKSLKGGKVNIGTVFYEARRNGYNPTEPFKAPTQEQLEARRVAQEASRIKAEQERALEMAEAVKVAAERWNKAAPLKDLNHPYLINKGIDDPKLTRQLRIEGNSLLLPLKKDGRIVGLQEINTKGGKYFTKGMDYKGVSMVIGSWSAGKQNGIVLTEGYATAASIHKATGKTVIACFSGNNLAAVAERIPKIDIPILIAADINDYKGAGLKYAQAAQAVLGGQAKVVAPTFTEADMKKFQELYNSVPSDFNDLHKLHGIDAVNQQFTQTQTQEMSESMSINQSEDQTKVVTNAEIEANNQVNTTELEVEENSLAPDFERLITAQQKIKQQTDIESKAQINEPEQNLESTSSPEAKQETIDLKKEFNKPLVTDLDYDHPPGELKVKYLCTKKGDYLDKAGVVQFKDKGAKLTSPKTDLETIQDMLSVAEAKGWSSIKVSGTQEFRRAAFLEANARGIAVQGYRPTDKDLAILEQMREERAKNQMEQAPVHSFSEKSLDASNSPNSQQQTQDKVADFNSGRLLEHGKANYQFDDKQKQSYFVTIENEHGQQKTTWGIGLEEAMRESQAKIGDRVELENLGRKPVEVETPVYDKDGKTIIDHKTIQTHRNFWEVKNLEQTQTMAAEKVETQQPSAAQVQSEKNTLLAQNTAPTQGHIESSNKVDLDSDIPMQNIGGHEIQSELKAFAATLTPKQQGLDKTSLAKLQTFKSVARMMISGLNKEDRSLAIRNFNEHMDKSIHGTTLNVPGHVPAPQERKHEAIKEQVQQREEELTR